MINVYSVCQSGKTKCKAMGTTYSKPKKLSVTFTAIYIVKVYLLDCFLLGRRFLAVLATKTKELLLNKAGNDFRQIMITNNIKGAHRQW
uniref:Uncharacterized protein n=1 Tax=Pyxicephalus adspersus TaxID=30357 RepID=A0AAV3AMY2_PYXAD|nr:TPA: hypothetical protein GDO54_000567 [Pyxicephalus adspersus]